MKPTAEMTREYRKQYPEKNRAHMAIATAVKRKKIAKPTQCELCGQSPQRIHAHHPDYSDAMRVVWVCQPCHENIHHPERKPDARKVHGRIPRHLWKSQPAPKRDTFKAQAVELRAGGKSYREISAALGVSVGMVYKWLNKTTYK